MGSGGTNGVGQEFCLKWNNHTTTILSVMDTLLEEESLVDVTLSADGQFLRAHRVILSACSPYFRQLFKSHFLQDKSPVIIMKDVEFDNLKCLVEYMYKGEANVPQHMLPSFIQTAESLQIRGLCDGASKQKLAELNNLGAPHLQIPSIPITPQVPVPGHFKSEAKHHRGPGDQDNQSILKARLAQMLENPNPKMMDLQKHLEHVARSIVPPPMKKPRKNPNTSTPIKPETNGLSVKKDLHGKNVRLSPKTSNIMAPSSVNSLVSALNNTNNNDESDSDVLKIDEDGDVINRDNKDIEMEKDGSDDDIAAVDNENGLDDSEEEIAMGNKEIAERTGNVSVGFINPWTGEEIPSSISDHDEDSLHDGMPGSGLVVGHGWPGMPGDTGAGAGSPTNRLKRLTNTDSVYTMCQTPEGPKFQCAMCARIFNLKCTLLRHVRHQHQGRFVPHPCKTCGQVFKRTDHLKVHMKKIHNINVVTSQNSPASTTIQPIVVSQTKSSQL